MEDAGVSVLSLGNADGDKGFPRAEVIGAMAVDFLHAKSVDDCAEAPVGVVGCKMFRDRTIHLVVDDLGAMVISMVTALDQEER